MNYQTKQISKSEIEITGQIEAGDFDNYYKKAFEEFSKNAEIPGFRKGQVPENIIKERIGEQAILEKAAEKAISSAWSKILEEKIKQGLEIIGRPQISITKLAKANPLEFKIIIQIIPEIKLGDYKEIAKEERTEKTEIKVEEKEIEQALEYLKKSKNFDHSQNLDQLKENIRKNILHNKEHKEKDRKRIALLEKIAEKSEMEIPEVLIEAEKEKMAQEMKASIENMGMKWQDYLAHLKKTEPDLKKGWQDDAKKRVRHGLILRQIANKENVEVLEGEINQKAEQMLQAIPDQERKKLDPGRLKDYAYGIIRNEKVFRLLEEA